MVCDLHRRYNLVEPRSFLRTLTFSQACASFQPWVWAVFIHSLHAQRQQSILDNAQNGAEFGVPHLSLSCDLGFRHVRLPQWLRSLLGENMSSRKKEPYTISLSQKQSPGHQKREILWLQSCVSWPLSESSGRWGSYGVREGGPRWKLKYLFQTFQIPHLIVITHALTSYFTPRDQGRHQYKCSRIPE